MTHSAAEGVRWGLRAAKARVTLLLLAWGPPFESRGSIGHSVSEGP